MTEPLVIAAWRSALGDLPSESLTTGGALRSDRSPSTKTRTTHSIPPEAPMRLRFVRPSNTAQAIASQLQSVAAELVSALRETSTVVERDRSRSGTRS